MHNSNLGQNKAALLDFYLKFFFPLHPQVIWPWSAALTPCKEMEQLMAREQQWLQVTPTQNSGREGRRAKIREV